MAISKDSCGLYYSQHSSWFEIRLFYIRIAPCVYSDVPEHLTLLHHRRDVTGGGVPSPVILLRDRVDKGASEVTYVSTDSVRVTGGVEFEVFEGGDMVLCGSLERLETVENGEDSMMGWGMDCYLSGSISSGDSGFFRPKMGVSSPLFEVYVAGCCAGVPVILTKIIQLSPRRKHSKHALLDAIPEADEIEKEHSGDNGLVRHRKLQITEAEDDYESDGKVGHNYYSEDMYYGEDGQLSWFNAGVRVGVGIGLGMCLGVGIGVGLLMRSYQTTTGNFRRRFF